MPAALPVPISDAHVGGLSINDLVAAIGVSRDGSCFYEARGLIRAQRRSNGYHAYPLEIVELVQYVRTAQQLGFILTGIKEDMSHVWQQPDTNTAITVLLHDKLAMTDTRIANLRAMRNVLATRVGVACPLASAQDDHHILSYNCRRLALQGGVFTFSPNLTAC